ncbi:hypothetical protein BFW01_g10568 [Lasiodiplodia theobromae]|uniref:Uncharacterized protein n=1 Tax=Lasiodiplodia theobromae TaxID=45133 RepID=A0A8H7IPY3_9PEZI|nr:hypothetical protein BFW01_g10568 [Lasiodiplodia theobromae]
MLADTAPSLRNLFPNALSLLSLSILLPLFLHLLWRLLLNPQNPKPSTQAHPEGKPTARKKSQSSFYGTPTTTPLNFTNVAPFPTSPSSSSSSPHVSTEPDRWYRDRTLISAPDRVYTPTMALRTCPFDDWLRVDTNYPARMTHKRNVLDAYGWKQVGGAMACRPEAEAAVRELLGFFKNVAADRLLMRVNWGINDREELFFLDGTHLYEGDEAAPDEKIDISQVQLRIERQVLRRLPRSGAICMLTKTYLYRLVEIAEEPGFAARLGGMLHKLPEKLAFYKRKPVWGKAVLAYLDEMAAKHPALPTDDE